MIIFLTILSIFIWPFGQLLNLQLPLSPITIYPLDLCTILLTTSLLVSRKYMHSLRSDPLSSPLLIFLSLATLALLINMQTALAGGVGLSFSYLLRLWTYPSIYYCVKYLLPKKYLRAISFSFIVFAILGIIQYLFFPDLRFLKLLGFDDHYFRLIGSFYDPNYTGAILAGAALALLALGHLASALPVVILLGLTFSRASFIVFIAGLVYMALDSRLSKVQKNSNLSSSRMRGSIWRLLAFLALLFVALVFAPKPFGEGVNLFRTFSIFSRLQSWQSGWDLFVERPVLGWGYNTLRFVNGERYQIDNSFLYLAATTGLLGLVAFLNLLLQAWKVLSSSPYRYFVLVVLLHSFFNNSLFYIWINFAFWGILGLASREYKES